MENKFKRIEYNNEKFRKNLEYLTRKFNITKKQVEKELEIGEGSLSRYCKIDENPTVPNIETVNSLANGFGVKIDEIINEDLEEKQKVEEQNKIKKEILFCNKLLEDTNNHTLEWYFCNLNEMVQEGYNNSILTQDPYNGEVQFHSKFSDRIYSSDMVQAIISKIRRGIEVLIVKLPIANENNRYRYELYLIKNSIQILAASSSHWYLDEYSMDIDENPPYDEFMYKFLSSLYENVSNYLYFGKERFEVEQIYNEYLYSVEEDDYDIPF